MEQENIYKKAESHAKWTSELVKEIFFKAYFDAFVHGYKHGREDVEKETFLAAECGVADEEEK